jgi:RNA polymerase sigma-70 factor (ECF subfamily)
MMDFPDTSQSLIARVREGADGAAWAEFLGIYRPVVYGMARRRGLQDADAQDVAQQVFLAVSGAIGDWESGSGQPPFRAWLRTITRNAVTKALTRRRPDAGTGSSSVRELLDALPADDPETTAEFLRESRRQAFRWAAEQIRPEFSPETWRLFWDTAVEGRSVAEAAAATGRSTGAVYLARYRVLRRLKAKVREWSSCWEA